MASQSLTHPLPHPVPELAWSEHLDVRHPRENPARQFLATGGLQAELQRAVPALPRCLARVPHPFADVGGHLAGEEQAHSFLMRAAMISSPRFSDGRKSSS